ncbi:vesicle coat component [Entomortierella beljakovae]|nr:vesicle coat component [Entomortierella beljakovae]
MTTKLFKATLPILLLILATAWVQLTSAVKFDLVAQDVSSSEPICVSHFVDEETQVVLKVKVGPGANQKVAIEVTDDSAHLNQLWKKDNLGGDISKTSFLNKEAGYKPDPKYSRTVDLSFEIGSETIDYTKLAEKEKLKPMEVELRKLEDLVSDILENMEHLQAREVRMRNTNESTNERVKWFSTLTMFVLVALGVWQIFYLKQFFRKKRLID